MSHNEKRAEWHKEFLMSAIGGCLYGGSNIVVGHPFDTVKTKMQA
jgi:solute carrier family 25 (mitochondrial carnitine/acylcarnitine transporter), member 20/29